MTQVLTRREFPFQPRSFYGTLEPRPGTYCNSCWPAAPGVAICFLFSGTPFCEGLVASLIFPITRFCVWACWPASFLDFPNTRLTVVHEFVDQEPSYLFPTRSLLGRDSWGSPLYFLFRFFLGSLRSVCIRLYARDRGGDCSLEEPLPTAKRNA